MSKLNILLVAVLVASALLLVKTSHEARQHFAALDRERTEARRLDAEFKRLDAEAQAAGTHLRVERTAREKLAMRTATPAVTMYVQDSAAAAQVGQPGPATPGTPTAAGQLAAVAPGIVASGAAR